jgi:SAM-dependent methyltransferase
VNSEQDRHAKAVNPEPDHEWFRDWFNEDYCLVYGHRDDLEARNFSDNWPVWSYLPEGGLCLDLGCGEGRYSRAVTAHGFRVVGIDLSRALLARALENEAPATSRSYIRGDIRSLPFKCGFDLAVSLFTSFGYFASDEEHLAVLREVAGTLRAGGMLVLDLPNRAFELADLATPSSRERIVRGCLVKESWNFTRDGNRIEKQILIDDTRGQRHYRESVRIFSRDDLLEMTRRAGFAPFTHIWGDYAGSEMNSGTRRMIYFGRKLD